MKEKGHSFLITARDKDSTLELAKSYGIEVTSRGKGSHSIFGRYIYLITFLFENIRIVGSIKPDICIGIGSPYLILIARLIKSSGIVFEDTESASKILGIYKWFADIIITLSGFRLNLGPKQISCNSFKELAYLHPRYFKPDPSVFHLLQISENERYVLFRFVSHQVNHDKKSDGLTPEMKRTLINKLPPAIKVFVSTEKGLAPQFPELELNIPPERMHDVVAHAQLVIGESATMASEAAVLGVPAIFFDNYGRGYTDELEKDYKMVTNYRISSFNVELAINKAIEILNTPDYVKTQTLHHRIIEDKIDVTAFMMWFAENYPESERIIKENPEYQYQFK